MTVRRYSVPLMANGELVAEGVFTLEGDHSLCTLTLEYPGYTLSASESDYFEALCTLRRELAKEAILPYCNGASRRCFPSGMSRDMGGGLRIYRLELGRHARTADLVFLFDTGPDLEATGVEEQERFYEEWLAYPKPPWNVERAEHATGELGD